MNNLNPTYVEDNHVDDHVDEEIQTYLSTIPSCFFAFAGAGSGKTTSLIKALNFISENQSEYFCIYKKRVAVITYTNAACDEIIRRAKHNAIFKVSTIHSFLWDLISNYQDDIKEWVKKNLILEIESLQAQNLNGNPTSQAQIKRQEKIKKNFARLEKIENVKSFSYNPNGENYGYDSLSHSQVIKMGSEFIADNIVMQKILISSFPIILVDESQDTKKELVDALVKLEKQHNNKVIIGMFGDTMQKIYTDGKDNLDKAIPQSWARPVKIMNHRSCKRIVDLANSIRQGIDDKSQKSRSDAKKGFVRLFIADSNKDKLEVEKKVFLKMAEITSDNNWSDTNKCKCLILEHHMAAKRFGFEQLFEPLDKVPAFDTKLREGSLPELSFLSRIVIPIVESYYRKDHFRIAEIVIQNSPLLSKKNLKYNANNQREAIDEADKAIEKLIALWEKQQIPSCLDIYNSLASSKIFELPQQIILLLEESDVLETNNEILALRKALSAPFTQLENYYKYISGMSAFDTHQGVKGLEFDRVAVIMDDEEARGFLFSYEKLFGAKAKTSIDIQNEKEGKDTSIDRTKRLFYVACTRAKESLAIIAYTQNKENVKLNSMKNDWFFEDEIEIL